MSKAEQHFFSALIKEGVDAELAALYAQGTENGQNLYRFYLAEKGE